MALQPILAAPRRCKGASELKEKLTAWALKVAEYGYHFKVIDEAHKTFVVAEMMPKGIRREFIIIIIIIIINNAMMADDGPAPMDLGSVGVHAAGMMQGDQDMSNDMSYDDMCADGWHGYKAGTGAGKKGPIGSGAWHRGKGADEWTNGTLSALPW